MDNCVTCIKAAEIETLKKQVGELSKSVLEIEKDKKLNEFQYKTIIETLAEMKLDIKDIKEKPSKRWDLIITGTISSIVAYIASMITK